MPPMPANPLPTPTAFAAHGCEKMIYDLRMGPQAIMHGQAGYFVYLAGTGQQGSVRGPGLAHPHIIRRDPDGDWSAPVRIGQAHGPNHHFAPVLWIDRRQHLHVLYNCHFTLNQSCHRVSARPLDITRWREAPLVAPSISYPRIVRLPGGRLLLYYRVLGHMGYWTYRLSNPDNAGWGPPAPPLVDFDHRPDIPGDEWAGSYHSIALGRDGRSLHVGMVRWDERPRVSPLYGKHVGLWSRYDLYYFRLDLRTGHAFNIAGRQLASPINRADAYRHCLVCDTGEHLTNMPTLLADPDDRPQFLLPIAGRRLNTCRLWFIRRHGRAWARHPVASTGNLWNAAHMEYAADGSISAFVIVDAPGGSAGREPLFYGGGLIHEYRSTDGGEHWRRVARIDLPPGFIANNPRPVEDSLGRPLPRTLTFFAWPGPHAIAAAGPYTAQAHLWQDPTP